MLSQVQRTAIMERCIFDAKSFSVTFESVKSVVMGKALECCNLPVGKIGSCFLTTTNKFWQEKYKRARPGVYPALFAMAAGKRIAVGSLCVKTDGDYLAEAMFCSIEEKGKIWAFSPKDFVDIQMFPFDIDKMRMRGIINGLQGAELRKQLCRDMRKVYSLYKSELKKACDSINPNATGVNQQAIADDDQKNNAVGNDAGDALVFTIIDNKKPADNEAGSDDDSVSSFAEGYVGKAWYNDSSTGTTLERPSLRQETQDDRDLKMALELSLLENSAHPESEWPDLNKALKLSELESISKIKTAPLDSEFPDTDKALILSLSVNTPLPGTSSASGAPFSAGAPFSNGPTNVNYEAEKKSDY